MQGLNPGRYFTVWATREAQVHQSPQHYLCGTDDGFYSGKQHLRWPCDAHHLMVYNPLLVHYDLISLQWLCYLRLLCLLHSLERLFLWAWWSKQPCGKAHTTSHCLMCYGLPLGAGGSHQPKPARGQDPQDHDCKQVNSAYDRSGLGSGSFHSQTSGRELTPRDALTETWWDAKQGPS